MKFDKIDWKGIGIVSVIIWLLSLPIMLWRGSRIGKIVMVGIILTMIIKFTVPISNQIEKVYTNFIVINSLKTELKSFKTEFKDIHDSIYNTSIKVRSLNESIDTEKKSILKNYQDKLLEKYTELDRELDRVENAVDVIKSSEREAVKERIIWLKDQIKIKGRKVDEYEIRMELEKVVDATFVLSDEQRKRFEADIKALGLEVEESSQAVVRFVSPMGYSMTSADVVTTFVTSDVSGYDWQYNNRRRRY